MPRIFKTTNVVLVLLCAMYFITYIVRGNINTAGSAIQPEFGLTNTQLGLIFSAYAYPYLLFQIIGGWTADRFGPRRTLAISGIVWAGATILTSLAYDFYSLLFFRVLMGFGVGATLPTATRAMQHWVESKRRGFAQGITHAFSRLGSTATPLLVASLMAVIDWRGTFIAIGLVGFVWIAIWFWYFRDDPKEHPSITEGELALLPHRPKGPRPIVPWGPLIGRMWPVTVTYFCYGWSLWLYINWIPLFFKNNYSLDIGKSAVFATGVFLAGVFGDTLGGVFSDLIYHKTGNVRLARLSIAVIGFTGALLSLIPIIYVSDITLVTICLSSGFFFAELVIGPMWAIPMDIAPKYSGTAAGLMNTGSALAAILSPAIGGYVIDVTHNWQLPFIISIGVLLVGALMSFAMHPERQFTDEGVAMAKPRAAPAE
jgi:MFS family permease